LILGTGVQLNIDCCFLKVTWFWLLGIWFWFFLLIPYTLYPTLDEPEPTGKWSWFLVGAAGLVNGFGHGEEPRPKL
jgi:hypothetical protein